MPTTAIIDYGAGNLRSVLNSVRHVAGLNDEIKLVTRPEEVTSADRVILPGVGAFHHCKSSLEASDMIPALNEFVDKGRPFLGICVGMQLLVDKGDEHGIETDGLGWIKGEITTIRPNSPDAKIPHMGWNNLYVRNEHPVLADLDSSDVYFVHSYSAQNVPPEAVLATTDYYGEITAIIGRDNILGLQFHPEKSQTTGLKILENFLNWRP